MTTNDADRIAALERRMMLIESVTTELRLMLRKAFNNYNNTRRMHEHMMQNGNGFDSDD
jgi:hypothetical protein